MGANTPLLRRGLLDRQRVAIAGVAPAGELASACERACAALGANVVALAPASAEEAEVSRAVQAAIHHAGSIDTLVNDAAAVYGQTATEAANDDNRTAALGASLDRTWNATRAVANAVWIEPSVFGGKVINLAPAPADPSEHDAGREGARAALENMARTLSIEWARYGIRITTITPGTTTTPEQVAELVSFLASPAGDYYSGCRFDLGSV